MKGTPRWTPVRAAVDKARIAEAGTSLSLADATTITTTDVRFPGGPQTSAEKMWAWSYGIDLYHGVNHDISVSVRSYVREVGPAFHRV